MKRLKRFANWQTMLLCLLIGCSAMGLRPAGAQGDRQPAEKRPGVPDGYTIIDGDIQMPISVVNAMRSQAQLSPNAPQATLDTKLWPNGIVPFRFVETTNCRTTSNCNGAIPSGCVFEADRQRMIAAMAVIEAVANVDFRECPNNDCGNRDHILIRDSTNDTKEGANKACVDISQNSSPVGRQGSQQTINIVDWGTQFIIVHELLHSLGFFHEQSRGDRDLYVEILTGNILVDLRHNFRVEDKATAYGYYDFDSVMHYGQCASSGNNPNCPNPHPVFPDLFPDGGITIKVKPPYNAQLSPDGIPWQANGRSAIGQRTRLSFLDRLSVSFLYPQPNWRFADLNYKGKNGASDGSFLRPYALLDLAINATPTGGVLWIQPGTYFVLGQVSKRITLRAPLGGVQINRLPGGLINNGPGPLALLSAASYNGELASESIAVAFGQNLASGTEVATSLPLPTTLAGTTVKIKDSEGAERDAPLFFVSPEQINYQVPAGASAGIAEITVHRGGNLVAKGSIPITDKAPGLFTADSSGRGAPAGFALRVRADGSQSSEPLARYDSAQQRFVPAPIDLGPEGEQVFLILFGSGFRAPSSSNEVSCETAQACPDELMRPLRSVRVCRNCGAAGYGCHERSGLSRANQVNDRAARAD